MNIKEELKQEIALALEEHSVEKNIIAELDNYLEDKEDEEFLNKLPKLDFRSLTYNDCRETFGAYISINEIHKDKDYLKKYMNILFQMGGTASSNLIRSIDIETLKDFIEAGIDRAKAFALYSDPLSFGYSSLVSKNFEVIYNEINENPEVIFKAMEYVNLNAQIMFYNLYCSSPNIPRNDDYYKYLKIIEDDLVASIGYIFDSKISQELVSKLVNFIEGKEEIISKELILELQSYKGDSYSCKYLFHFLIGFSALNGDKSRILKRCFKSFVEVDFRSALNAAYDILPISSDCCSNDVVNLDLSLEIPAKYHIAWYVEKFDKKLINREILNQKLIENKAAFEEAIELCNKDSSNYLMSFMLDGEDNEKYRKLLENNFITIFIAKLSKGNLFSEQIKAIENFLYGVSSFDEVKEVIYSIEHTPEEYYSRMEDMINPLKVLAKKVNDKREVYERSIVVLSILGELLYIESLAQKDKDDETSETDGLKMERKLKKDGYLHFQQFMVAKRL